MWNTGESILPSTVPVAGEMSITVYCPCWRGESLLPSTVPAAGQNILTLSLGFRDVLVVGFRDVAESYR